MSSDIPRSASNARTWPSSSSSGSRTSASRWLIWSRSSRAAVSAARRSPTTCSCSGSFGSPRSRRMTPPVAAICSNSSSASRARCSLSCRRSLCRRQQRLPACKLLAQRLRLAYLSLERERPLGDLKLRLVYAGRSYRGFLRGSSLALRLAELADDARAMPRAPAEPARPTRRSRSAAAPAPGAPSSRPARRSALACARAVLVSARGCGSPRAVVRRDPRAAAGHAGRRVAARFRRRGRLPGRAQLRGAPGRRRCWCARRRAPSGRHGRAARRSCRSFASCPSPAGPR